MHRVLAHTPKLVRRLVELYKSELGLARRLAVSPAQVASWAKGETAPDEASVHAMVALLIKAENQATRRRARTDTRKRELRGSRKS